MSLNRCASLKKANVGWTGFACNKILPCLSPTLYHLHTKSTSTKNDPWLNSVLKSLIQRRLCAKEPFMKKSNEAGFQLDFTGNHGSKTSVEGLRTPTSPNNMRLCHSTHPSGSLCDLPINDSGCFPHEFPPFFSANSPSLSLSLSSIEALKKRMMDQAREQRHIWSRVISVEWIRWIDTAW